MNRNQFMTAYSINEVSKKINTPTGTIRQWEKDLNGLLIIPRTKQGARYYTDNEINLLEKIKAMRNQNIHKGMIRTLLEKHLTNQTEEATSDSFVKTSPSQSASNNNALEPISEYAPSIKEYQFEELYNRMDSFKQELLHEVKHEMASNKKELISEIKSELGAHSLNTVQGISKSIQRSNEKRKGEVQNLSNAITQVSEHTSERFETIANTISNYTQGTYKQFKGLSTNITKASEETIEHLSKQIDKTLLTSSSDNQKVLFKVTKSLGDVNTKLNGLEKSLETEQRHIAQSLNELKESAAKIQQREEVFQDMVANFREVAAAKSKKQSWWKFWG